VNPPAIALAERVDELRDAFDRSFTVPRRAESEPFEHVLAIRVGGEPYAVRLDEVAGLYVDWPVTPVPGPSADLLGVAELRGSLVPVYHLRGLLGRAAAGVPEVPRYAVLSAGTDPVAFAFDALDGHLRVAPDTFKHADARSVAANSGGDGEHDDLADGGGDRAGRTIIRLAGASWVVVSLPALVTVLRARSSAGRASTSTDAARDGRS
jgi:chemotaxis signal transduction protein